MATTERSAKGAATTVEKVRVNVMIPADVLAALDLDAQRCKIDRSAAIVEAVQARLAGSGRSVALSAPVAPVVVDVPNADEIAAAVVAKMSVMPPARPMLGTADASPDRAGDDNLVMQALGTVYLHVLAVEHMLADEWEQAWVTLDKKGTPRAGAGQQLRQDATRKATTEMAMTTRTARR